MSGEIKRREPGKRVFPAREHEKQRSGGATLVLVLPPPQEPNRPAPKVDPSGEVQEMLREMNRRPAIARNTDAPDAA